jgi:hypothetical protein
MADTRSLMSACGLAALWGAAALSECVGKSHVSLLFPIYILWDVINQDIVFHKKLSAIGMLTTPKSSCQINNDTVNYTEAHIVFICSSFNDSISNLDYIMSRVRVTLEVVLDWILDILNTYTHNS